MSVHCDLDYLRQAVTGWAAEVRAIEFRAHQMGNHSLRDRCSEIATGLLRAVAGKCDGNHCGPRCADPECWLQ